MVYKVFTVFDAAAAAYLPPFFVQTHAQAVRAFSDLARDPQHQFSKHASDYTLFEIASYDDQTGAFQPFEAPKPFGTALEYKSQENVR